MAKERSEQERLAIEAQAKITWGDSPREVQLWLQASGLSRVDAEQIVEACVGERSASMRKRGVVDTSIAIACGVATLVLGVVSWWFMNVEVPDAAEAGGRPASRLVARLAVAGFVLCVLSGLGAVHFGIRGGERLLRGAKAEGADMDDD